MNREAGLSVFRYTQPSRTKTLNPGSPRILFVVRVDMYVLLPENVAGALQPLHCAALGFPGSGVAEGSVHAQVPVPFRRGQPGHTRSRISRISAATFLSCSTYPYFPYGDTTPRLTNSSIETSARNSLMFLSISLPFGGLSPRTRLGPSPLARIF